jgi:hypothetical protein
VISPEESLAYPFGTFIISRQQPQTLHGSPQETLSEPHENEKVRPCMAQQPPIITFEDIPLDEARRMGRGPRMDPELYRALHEKLQSLGNTATRMTIEDGTNPTTLKNRILRVAAELGVSVTIRKVPGGLLFWRSTAEDLAQAKAVAQRLQPARRKGRASPSRRRRP